MDNSLKVINAFFENDNHQEPEMDLMDLINWHDDVFRKIQECESNLFVIRVLTSGQDEICQQALSEMKTLEDKIANQSKNLVLINKTIQQKQIDSVN